MTGPPTAAAAASTTTATKPDEQRRKAFLFVVVSVVVVVVCAALGLVYVCSPPLHSTADRPRAEPVEASCLHLALLGWLPPSFLSRGSAAVRGGQTPPQFRERWTSCRVPTGAVSILVRKTGLFFFGSAVSSGGVI